MPDSNVSFGHVPVYRFGRYDKIVVGDVEYRWIDTDREGHRLRRQDTSDVIQWISHDDIQRHADEGRFACFRDWHQPSRERLRHITPKEFLNSLDDDERPKIVWRMEFCDRFLKMEAEGKATRSDTSMETAIREIDAQLARLEIKRSGKKARAGQARVVTLTPPKPSCLRKMLNRYAAFDYHPAALIDMYGRGSNKKSRISAESAVAAKQFVDLYADSRRPTKIILYEQYLEHVEKENETRNLEGRATLHVLSRRSFEVMIDKLDPYHVLAAREGEARARAKFGIVMGGQDVTRPLERVEMDEWNVSIQTLMVEAGVWELFSPQAQEALNCKRCWLTAAICVATKCILSLRLSPEEPSKATAISAFEMALFPKTHAAARDCRTALLHPPAGVPELRGFIERSFGTLQRRFARHFTGQTFENVVRKGDYNSEGNAAIDFEELNRTLVRFVVDAYHNTPHAGLAGETPYNAWLRLTRKHGVLPPPSAAERRHIFGISVTRCIQNKGVCIFGIHYQSKELQLLRREVRRKEVQIRIDRFNLGEISIQTKRGWISARPAIQDLDLSDVTLWDWMAATMDLRKRNADIAKLSLDTVRNALSYVRETADVAARRAELGSPTLGEKDFERIEERLFRAFGFAALQQPDDQDILGQAEPEADDADFTPTPNTPPSDADFGTEDDIF